MFLGTHSPRLDDKGRLILPAKFRPELKEGLVIAKGHERCLVVYPMAQFQELAQDLQAERATHKSDRDYNRVFFASASDEVPDGQGRITIPPELREYARLSKDCTVIGQMSYAEIWDAEAWEDYLRDRDQAFSDSER